MGDRTRTDLSSRLAGRSSRRRAERGGRSVRMRFRPTISTHQASAPQVASPDALSADTGCFAKPDNSDCLQIAPYSSIKRTLFCKCTLLSWYIFLDDRTRTALSSRPAGRRSSWRRVERGGWSVRMHFRPTISRHQASAPLVASRDALPPGTKCFAEPPP